MKDKIQNPFIKNSPIVFKKTIPIDYLVHGYKDLLDVNYLFKKTKKVFQFECQKSGFLFFYPYSIAGDSHFYEVLQEYDWYYMPWKWENEYCQKYISNGNHILDVGSGQGNFLKRIGAGNKTLRCVGLELNETSTYNKNNVEVLNQTIEDYALINENSFDVVCSFQVLEHIPQVFSFLEGKVRALKKGGHLLIAVPNNDSDFLKSQKDAYLNMPPHHMGHWNEKSLTQIATLFNLKLVEIAKEPLQPQHYLPYWYGSLRAKFGLFIAKIAMKFVKVFGLTNVIENKIGKKANEISGHTILAIYQKI